MLQKEEKQPEFDELKEDKRMKKRLFTIVLAIALLSSMLALPAAATEVEPRARMIDCGVCETPCPIRSIRVSDQYTLKEANCGKTHAAAIHDHKYTDFEERLHCETCGDFLMATYRIMYCGEVYIGEVNRVEIYGN